MITASWPIEICFYAPQIPGNSGNAIRLSALTGVPLHLVRPLGFEMSSAHLRRAGLDYHDLAQVQVHDDWESMIATVRPNRILAFTAHAQPQPTLYTLINYRRGDLAVFGPEDRGLPPAVLSDERTDLKVRLPMRPGTRSLNLANSAAIVVYEAWRQHGFSGSA